MLESCPHTHTPHTNREKETEKDREKQRERERQRETHTQRHRQRDRERHREHVAVVRLGGRTSVPAVASEEGSTP
jgi:hypothetical protein